MNEQDAIGTERFCGLAVGQSRQAVFVILTIIVVVGCGPTNKAKSRAKTPNDPKQETQPHARIKLPEVGPPISAKESVVIIIRSAGKDKVTVHRGDGEPFTEGDNEKQEQEVVDYIAAGLNGAEPFNNKKSNVLVKAEKGIKHKEVARIAQAIGRVEMSANVIVETVYIKAGSTKSPKDAQGKPE